MLFQNRYVQAVKFLCSFIPKKSSLKILEGIKVSQKKESITYEASDLDNFLRIRLPLWGSIEGNYLVSSKYLLKAPKMIASKISADKIHFGNLAIPVMDIKEFPSLETGFFKNPVWEQLCFSKRDFLSAANRACNYVATDISRQALTGVYFHNGFLYATNGHYLLKAKTALKAKKDVEFIISRTFIKLISNEFVLDDEIDLSVFFTDKEQGYIVARGMSFELVSKLIPCPYPDIEKAIPKKMPFAFSIEREPFLDTVKKAELYANKKNRMTELSPGKKENELSIIVKDMDEGVEFSEQILAKMLTKPKWNGIAFNAKSMSAILSDAPGRMLTLKAGEKQISAITIEPTGHDELYFLLMPLRKTDDGHTEAENQDARDKKENVSSQNSTGTKNPKEAESKKPVS